MPEQEGVEAMRSPELEPLRRVFTAFPDEAPAPESCPEPDRIWAAVHGELAADETHQLIDHTAACPACAEEWRLAREIGRQTASAGVSQTAATGGRVLAMGHRFRRLAAPLAGLAAAAVLLLVVGMPRDSPAPPNFRDGEMMEIRSLLPRDVVLARDSCVLRWSEIEDVLYNVLVSDADLVVVARAENLAQSRFQVPPQSLARLAAGAELYWQVEAVLPDGSSRSSRTFLSRIQ